MPKVLKTWTDLQNKTNLEARKNKGRDGQTDLKSIVYASFAGLVRET